MSKTNCGFHGDANGPILLVQRGPAVWVDVGFDPEFRPNQNKPPKAGITNIEALIDTGAVESVIDSALAERLNLPIVNRRNVAGATAAMEVNVHLAQIHIPSLRFTQNGSFCGLPLVATGFHYSVIVGRTLLQYLFLSYDGPSATVTISFEDHS